jgi:hypothetical protein
MLHGGEVFEKQEGEIQIRQYFLFAFEKTFLYKDTMERFRQRTYRAVEVKHNARLPVHRDRVSGFASSDKLEESTFSVPRKESNRTATTKGEHPCGIKLRKRRR